MGIVKLNHIIKQLKEDLIGKDSYRGVTLTYAWLANQFGHFSLGFIPTLAIFWFFDNYTSISNPSIWSAITTCLLWLIFEILNLLGPLLTNKISKFRTIYIPSAVKYTFQPAWNNLIFDTITDLLYFWIGAFSASVFIKPLELNIIIVVSLFIILIYPSIYWYITKMYIQYANYPIQFRLSQWNRSISKEDKINVEYFINNSRLNNGNHLLIFGGKGTGKSHLSIAIGTELSIQNVACSYFTCVKLISQFTLSDNELINAEDVKIWSWRSSDLLIIDDINPGKPILENFITPDVLLKYIRVSNNETKSNEDILRGKNVIWIIGNDFRDSTNTSVWLKMLFEMNVTKNKIKSISLDL